MVFKMNADDMISVLKGKISEIDPRKAFTGVALGTTLSLAGAALIYGDLEQFNESIKNTMNAGVRSASLYVHDMISDNIYSIESLKAIATNVDNEVLAGAGMLSAGALYHTIKKNGISDTGASIYHAIVDSIETLGIDKKRAKRGLLYTGILAVIGTSMATSGCLDFGGDDTVVTTSTDNIPTPEPIEPTPVETETQVETNIIEPVAEQVETPWYVDQYGFEDADVGIHSTLFDDVYAVKSSAYGDGNYNLYSIENSESILKHQEFTPSNLRLDLDLSSDQYRALNAQYGTMISATMETIDLDRDGTMDQVAIHYVGTGGDEGKVLEIKTDYQNRWQLRDYLITYFQ